MHSWKSRKDQWIKDTCEKTKSFYWAKSTAFCGPDTMAFGWVKKKQARKLQATLEGCNPKLSLTDSLTDMGKV